MLCSEDFCENWDHLESEYVVAAAYRAAYSRASVKAPTHVEGGFRTVHGTSTCVDSWKND